MMTTAFRAPSLSLATSLALLLGVSGAAAQSIKIDHTLVDVTVLDSGAIEDAAALRMNFSHASVGSNIWEGLQTLAEDPTYAFPNWTENARGNPGWQAKIADFETWVAAHESENDVFQNKFCFIDQEADFTTYRDSMVGLEASYPEKTFVWWTMPITIDDGFNPLRAEFNQAVRDYCAENDCPLFDIADIESHTAKGAEVTSGGVEALDPDQASDESGHLNTLGSARMAQAQWVLMARIAGAEVVGTPAGGGGNTDSVDTAGSGSDADTSQDSGKGSSDSGCSVTTSQNRGALGGATMAALLVGLLISRRRALVR
jgi:hypothetical protein